MEPTRCAGARLIEQAIEPSRHEPRPPFADHLLGDAELLGHRGIGRVCGAPQHDPRAQRHRLRRLGAARPVLQHFAFVGAQFEPRFRPPAFLLHPPTSSYQVDNLKVSLRWGCSPKAPQIRKCSPRPV
jgi:hypothetical protein